MAAAGGRVAAGSCRKRKVRVKSRRRPCARRQSRSTHEAPAFKVDSVDLFLVAGAPHGGRKRPLGCSAANFPFSSLTLLMAAAGGRVAAESCRTRSVRVQSRQRPCARQNVEVRTKRPRKGIYFSSLTPLMAAASGNVAARQQTCLDLRASRRGPAQQLLSGAAGQCGEEGSRGRYGTCAGAALIDLRASRRGPGWRQTRWAAMGLIV